MAGQAALVAGGHGDVPLIHRCDAAVAPTGLASSSGQSAPGSGRPSRDRQAQQRDAKQ
jgi:hypothetical protein